MKILTYGIPAAVVGRIAGRYGFRLAASLDQECGKTGLLLPIRTMESPAGLLALYNELIAREAEIDAVIVNGTAPCGASGMIRYGSPQGKLFTLSGDEEMLEYEFERIVESLLGMLCAHEGIRPVSFGGSEETDHSASSNL